MTYYLSDPNPNRPDLYRFDLNRDIGDFLPEDDLNIDTPYLLDNYDKENSHVSNELKQKKEATNNKINSLNKFNLRERPNVPPKATKNPKPSRTIYPYEAAASIQQNETDKIKGISDDYSIKQHAFMRIQAFAITVVGLYGIAKRSGGKKDREIKISVKSAPSQVGQASNSGDYAFHGAHDNATSGLDLEGFRESLIKEIVEDTEISPIKKRLLKRKNFTNEQFAAILKNPDENTVRAIFDIVWPMNKNKPHTVFTGTQTDLNLNTTTEAGIIVNLGIDKHIESHRNEICDLYLKITHAEITQEEACVQYCTIIKDSLTKFELDVENSLTKIEDFQENLLELDDYESMFQNHIRTILGNLHEQAKVINPPKNRKKSDSNKEDINPENKPPKIRKDADFHPKIIKNKKFLNNSIYSIDKNKSDPLCTFKIWMVKRWDALKNEISDQQTKLAAYLKYCRLENEGTEVPDFTALFGEFNPETGKRELNDRILSSVQEKLWDPLPTTTKRLRDDSENNSPSKHLRRV